MIRKLWLKEMPKLTLTYTGERVEGAPPFSNYIILSSIECEDMLDGLAILHERLNGVAMPRVYRSTADGDTEDFLSGLRAGDSLPVTVSC